MALLRGRSPRTVIDGNRTASSVRIEHTNDTASSSSTPCTWIALRRIPASSGALISAHAGEASALYEAHVNPRLAKALRLIRFDRCYVKGSGPYLWDSNGRRYLDMLSLEGVNLFYLWPFIEIMPVPLSPEDRAYLEECRRVVDYAQQKHGMEVWIMQCTNRVAKDRCGVADPRKRPYWRPSQEDLSPGTPAHLRAILASREALYRALPNVDGVCNIDSDPGYYAGSPLGDYLKVLQGCRDLLDKCNVHGRQAKLVNWMWCGWGLPPARFFDANHQNATIDTLRRGRARRTAAAAPRRSGRRSGPTPRGATAGRAGRRRSTADRAPGGARRPRP